MMNEDSTEAPSATDPNKHRPKKVMMAAQLTMLLWSTAFFMQSTTLPYLTKRHGIDTKTYGYFKTTFSIIQLSGAPLFGKFGDRYGGRDAMTLALTASAVMFFMVSTADSASVLFLSRLPAFIFHGLPAGQMIVTDVSEPKYRVDALGKLGMFYGLGVIIGPIIGGAVGKMFGIQAPAFVSFLIALFNIFFTQNFIPKETKHFLHHSENKEKSPKTFKSTTMLDLISTPKVLLLLLLKTGIGFPTVIFQNMFAVIAMQHFNLPPHLNGLILSYNGLLGMLIKGIGLGFIMKLYKESSILKWSVSMRICAYFVLIFTTNIWQFCILCQPILVCASAAADVLLVAKLTKSVAKNDTGVLLGLTAAVGSLVRTLAPTIGGLMFFNFGFSSFGVLGMVSCAIMLLFVKYAQTNKTSTLKII